ncbi:MAG: M48 family metallopeptidase [Synergistaceae bacterium]|nr:M48 family metallopeptidase [Synergistaceae bacterium]
MRKFITLLIFLTLCEAFTLKSEAALTRHVVNNAWRRIAQAADFPELAINFEDDEEPNAWVLFHDINDYSVHVTTGLMSLLRTEDEIAGVLGHELGHIMLGHYNNDVLIDTAKIIMNSNSDSRQSDSLAAAIGNIEFELRESSFSREQETQADEYGSKILVKAGYDSRGLYNAIKRIADSGFMSSESNGFSSHPAGQERLSNLAELAGISRGSDIESDAKIDELANILLGK